MSSNIHGFKIQIPEKQINIGGSDMSSKKQAEPNTHN